MCLIITVVSLMLAYNFFMSGNMLAGIGSLLVALFFIYLMVNNILFVKKLKNNKRDDIDS